MGSYELILALYNAILKADALSAVGVAEGLDADRKVLKKGQESAEAPYNRWKFGEGFKFPWEAQ